MQNELLFYIGIIVSCLVTTVVCFQFFDSRYSRSETMKISHPIMVGAVSAFLMFINVLQNPLLNILSWIFTYALVAFFCYSDDEGRPFRRVVEAEVMVLVFAVCEAAGVFLLDFLIQLFKVSPPQADVMSFLSMTFSMLVLLLLYYVFILRLWGKKEKVRFTKTQSILHFIIAGYSFINMLVIVEVVGKVRGEMVNFLLLLNMGVIVFADLYFLYFIHFIEENNQLKTKLELYEQQASIQYEYYKIQEKQYDESVRVLHDVNKHIAAIEGLYRGENKEEAVNYTREINTILEPLIPQQLVKQPILNILLNDKINNARHQGIELQCDIENVNLDFLDPIDITTIFGNLLDNAIEACTKVNDRKWIHLKISPHLEMVAIRIENATSDATEKDNYRPVSKKGKNHGIGLYNVDRSVKKYNGTIDLNCHNKIFQCNVILSQ